MLAITASGYVTGEVKVQDGEYGRSATLGIRCKTGNGKQTHFVNAVFYGKKIETAQKYLEDGRQVTVVGTVKSIMQKKKKDGTEYVAMYVDVQEFTLPEMKSSEESYAAASRSRKAVASIPDQANEDDDIPF
jgi:single-stranded DNA-binding protein